MHEQRIIAKNPSVSTLLTPTCTVTQYHEINKNSLQHTTSFNIIFPPPGFPSWMLVEKFIKFFLKPCMIYSTILREV
jgi:hypothetical protein